MKTKWWIWLSVGVLLSTGITLVIFLKRTPSALPHYPLTRAAIQALVNDPNAVFYSINPAMEDPEETFCGYGVVAKATLVSKDDREHVADFLDEVILAPEHGKTAFCFIPHHGFRATGPDGVYEMILCFSCVQGYVNTPRGGESFYISDETKGFHDFLSTLVPR